MMLASAAFLQGLFYTAKDLLLVDPGFLKQVDGLLCALSDQDFDALLPELRLAFSYFVPMETDRIAGRQRPCTEERPARCGRPGSARRNTAAMSRWMPGRRPGWQRRRYHERTAAERRRRSQPVGGWCWAKTPQDQMPLEGGPKLARMDDALDFLYSREAGPDVRDDIPRERQGGSGASQLTVARWLSEVRQLFPQETAEVLQRHALDRYHLTELLTDREVLEKMEPDQALLETILSLKG